MNLGKLNNYFLTVKLISSIGIFVAVIFTLPHAYGQITEPEQLATPEISDTVTVNSPLLETPIFNNRDQGKIIVSPSFNNNTTNVAFYMKCPSVSCPDIGTSDAPTYIFAAENLGHGALPFSEYWAPGTVSDYAVVEYANDNQQFSCSDLSLESCLLDEHFLNVYYFALVEDETPITPQMLSEKNELNTGEKIVVTTATSTASDALLSLSITLSSTSISSDLDNGLIVTASLDGVIGVSIATTTTESEAATTTEPKDEPATDSFFQNIVDAVIDIFTPDEPTQKAAVIETILPEQTTEQIPVDTTPTEPSPNVETEITPSETSITNEVQSSASNEDTPDNEVTTTTF